MLVLGWFRDGAEERSSSPSRCCGHCRRRAGPRARLDRPSGAVVRQHTVGDGSARHRHRPPGARDAYPSDGVDRFAVFSSAIATDLGAVDTWWRHQDYTRTPRFDLADLGCPGTMGSLDISDVQLP